MPRVVPQRAGVVEEADARWLPAGVQQFLARPHQWRQPFVAPVQRCQRIVLRRRAPEDRQHHVDACRFQVLQLPPVPRHRFPAQPFQRRRMSRERVRAVAVEEVRLGRRVVPVEVVGADDPVRAPPCPGIREIGGVQVHMGTESRRDGGGSRRGRAGRQTGESNNDRPEESAGMLFHKFRTFATPRPVIPRAWQRWCSCALTWINELINSTTSSRFRDRLERRGTGMPIFPASARLR